MKYKVLVLVFFLAWAGSPAAHAKKMLFIPVFTLCDSPELTQKSVRLGLEQGFSAKEAMELVNASEGETVCRPSMVQMPKKAMCSVISNVFQDRKGVVIDQFKAAGIHFEIEAMVLVGTRCLVWTGLEFVPLFDMEIYPRQALFRAVLVEQALTPTTKA